MLSIVSLKNPLLRGERCGAFSASRGVFCRNENVKDNSEFANNKVEYVKTFQAVLLWQYYLKYVAVFTMIV
jgi:hypothetical protein